MISFIKRNVKSTDSVSDKYIGVNNFGYYEDIDDMHICRERGRVDYQLIYVKSGEIVVKEMDSERILKRGEVCLFRPKEAQIYQIFGTKTSFFWIHFSGCGVEEMLSFFKERLYYVGVLPEFEHYCRGFVNEFDTESEFSELLYEGRLISLIARIGERINSDEKRERERNLLMPALTWMRSDSVDALSNEELASLCGISKYYFIKIFKQVMGVTPQHYYTTLVVDKARYLLTNTSYNISEISFICGIEDSLYFSRMFKKHMGVSPKEYRQIHR